MTELHVLRVFCDADGRHGNPLGVVVDGAAVPEGDRQGVAAALGYSETVFVQDAAGRVRIFTPTTELSLAGHPLVGASWLLAHLGRPVEALRPPAGEVRTEATPEGAWIEADPAFAPPFELRRYADVAEVDELTAPRGPDVHLDAWAWEDEWEGRIRARVFADGVGVPEDEATGAAALRLVAALDRSVTIRQGRGSIIEGRAVQDGLVRIGGRVVRDDVVALEDRVRELRTA